MIKGDVVRMIELKGLYVMGKMLMGVDQFVELFDNGYFNGIGFFVVVGIFIGSVEEIGIKD